MEFASWSHSSRWLKHDYAAMANGVLFPTFSRNVEEGGWGSQTDITRSKLDFMPLAFEHEQPPRTHKQFHGKIEKQHGARPTVDNQAENPPDGKRVGKEHRPDHRHMPPL